MYLQIVELALQPTLVRKSFQKLTHCWQFEPEDEDDESS